MSTFRQSSTSKTMTSPRSKVKKPSSLFPFCRAVSLYPRTLSLAYSTGPGCRLWQWPAKVAFPRRKAPGTWTCPASNSGSRSGCRRLLMAAKQSRRWSNFCSLTLPTALKFSFLTSGPAKAGQPPNMNSFWQTPLSNLRGLSTRPKYWTMEKEEPFHWWTCCPKFGPKDNSWSQES